MARQNFYTSEIVNNRLLLRRSQNLGADQHFRLRDLLRYNLKTICANLL